METEYKLSKYNFVVKNDDESLLLYNSLSNGFIELIPPYKGMFEQFLLKDKNISFNNEDENKLKENLLRGHMIHDVNLDPLDILRVRNRTGRYNLKSLGITILPTLNCNFNCIYCTEDRRQQYMTDETYSKVIEFIKNKMLEKQSLSITYYGGEPLLCGEKIFEFSYKLHKIAETNKWYINQMMVSNGYLLDKATALKMQELKIGSVQITIDGIASIHNKRRPHVNNSGTYEKIIQNIKDICGIIGVVVRVNLDKTNYKHSRALVDCLEGEGLKEKISLYFSPVKPYTEVCMDIGSSCIGDKTFSSLEVDLYEYAHSRGFRVTRYPSLKFGYCGADNDSSFCISPDGSLFKCWNEVSFPDKSYGNIHNMVIDDISNYKLLKWLAWDPFEKTKCKSCNIFPICMSGCPDMAITAGSKTKGVCYNAKYNLKRILLLHYNIKKQLMLKQGIKTKA